MTENILGDRVDGTVTGVVDVVPDGSELVDTVPDGYGIATTTRIPVDQRTKSKVCIVGFADGHRHLAPFNDPDMEFWGINRLHAVLPDVRFDRWFEIHELDKYYPKGTPDGDGHRQFLKQFAGPIYVRGQDMGQAQEWGIDATAYPMDAIRARFEMYFTNTVSYLIAMAIMMDFKEIHIYGVDMAQDQPMQQEYREQRPSCEYFLGLAQGLGIKIVLPPGSDLLKTSQLYGFDDDAFRDKMQARMQEIGQRKENIRQERHQHVERAEYLQFRLSELDGSLQELQYQLTNLVTPAALPDSLPTVESG